jgi:hypothetical protein
MKTIVSFKVKIHKTTDKKKVQGRDKIYEYGAINVRSPELAKYVGKKVKVRVEELPDSV